MSVGSESRLKISITSSERLFRLLRSDQICPLGSLDLIFCKARDEIPAVIIKPLCSTIGTDSQEILAIFLEHGTRSTFAVSANAVTSGLVGVIVADQVNEFKLGKSWQRLYLICIASDLNLIQMMTRQMREQHFGVVLRHIRKILPQVIFTMDELTPDHIRITESQTDSIPDCHGTQGPPVRIAIHQMVDHYHETMKSFYIFIAVRRTMPILIVLEECRIRAISDFSEHDLSKILEDTLGSLRNAICQSHPQNLRQEGVDHCVTILRKISEPSRDSTDALASGLVSTRTIC